jgi:hypothetical protein
MSVTLIYSSNLNPVYVKFSILQEEVCQHLGMRAFFCKSGAAEWSIGEDDASLPSIEGVPDVFVAQVSRYILPAFFPDRMFIVGDVDMLFLSRRFTDKLQSRIAGLRGLMLMDSDTYNHVLRFPCCYYIGTGRIFAEILGLKEPTREAVEELIRQIWARNEGWTGDEYYFSEAAQLAADRIEITHYNQRVKTFFGRREKLKGRINRSNWRYTRLGLIAGRYIDVHCVRPIEQHIPELRHIFNYVYCGLDGWRYLKYEFARIFRGKPDLFPASLTKP